MIDSIEQNISYIGGVILGSEIMRDMVLFNDPVYPSLAILGIFFSIFSLIHELIRRSEKRMIKILNGMILAIISGALITPIAFLILDSVGSYYMIKHYDIELGVLDSIWWLISLILAVYSISIIKIIDKAIKYWGRRWN